MADSQVTIPEENWKEIPGFLGYEVSDLGRVKSPRGTILRQTLSEGYPRVPLGCNHRIRVHLLVLLTFRGPCPPGHEGCHEDGIRTHVALDNLRWDTRSGNHRDKRKHGTIPNFKGMNHPKAKLTDSQVFEIRNLYASGHRKKDLAKMFELKWQSIHLIITRKNWSHLP